MATDMKPTAASARRTDDHSAVPPVAFKSIGDPKLSNTHLNGAAAVASDMNINLAVAIVAVHRDAPVVLVTTSSGVDALPSSRLQPGLANLETCLREGVAEQTGLELGYAEQLLASADGRTSLGIGYLALTRSSDIAPSGNAWRSWYDYLPWEDWRSGRPAVIASQIEPRLREWSEDPANASLNSRGLTRVERARMTFGLDRTPWNEERVADRFELLCETGLIGAVSPSSRGMRLDHMRMLANAIGRLRAKLKIRPVIFELMEREFTLFELQKTVEAILGPHLHKQNFRRLIESAGLVEPTGEVRSKTGGRPAKLFRFRHEVLMERPAPGVRVHAQHN